MSNSRDFREMTVLDSNQKLNLRVRTETQITDSMIIAKKEVEPIYEANNEEIGTFDQIFEIIGGYGAYQKWLTLSLILIGIGNSYYSIGTQFYTQIPVVKCYENETLTSNHLKTLKDASCEWYNSTQEISLRCEHGYFPIENYIDERSMAIDRQWFCKDNFSQRSITQSIIVYGNQIGALLAAYFVDIFGRKRVLKWLKIGVLLSSIAIIFVHHYILFFSLNFIIGCVCGAGYYVSFILMLEFVSNDQKILASNMYGCFWALSILLTSSIFMIVDSWKIGNWIQTVIHIEEF